MCLITIREQRYYFLKRRCERCLIDGTIIVTCIQVNEAVINGNLIFSKTSDALKLPNLILSFKEINYAFFVWQCGDYVKIIFILPIMDSLSNYWWNVVSQTSSDLNETFYTQTLCKGDAHDISYVRLGQGSPGLCLVTLVI